MRLLAWALIQYSRCLYFKKETWTHAPPGRAPCEDEGQRSGWCSRCSGTQRWPANHQKPGRGTNRFSLTAPRKDQPHGTLVLDVWPPGLWDSTFLLFKVLCYGNLSKLSHWSFYFLLCFLSLASRSGGEIKTGTTLGKFVRILARMMSTAACGETACAIFMPPPPGSGL